jgi:hypothetical protein
MLVFELRDPHWIIKDEPEIDLCAHGGVEIRANQITFSDGAESDWTVSAAALYFLRTLTQDHTIENAVCDQLIPCCGFNMHAQGDGEDVILSGCPNGINFEVRHQMDNVILTNLKNEETTITQTEWQQAVFRFADTVEDFYRSSKPKQPEDEESSRGYQAFWGEWKRRRISTIFPKK